MLGWVGEALTAVLAALFAITLHEAAHGLAARALGDDTAQKMGRISLNPLRHLDPVGSLLVPAVMILGQLLVLGAVQGVFGWAKPVPIDVTRFARPRFGIMVVAAAGPAMNALLAVLSALLVHGVLAAQGVIGTAAAEVLLRFLLLSALANLVLGLFNLLPLPPLDGGRILICLLPRPFAPYLAGVEAYGLAVVLGVFFLLPVLVPLVNPFGWFFQTLVAPTLSALLWLTGHGR